MLCKICFTIIFCCLHLRRNWHNMCQKNGEAYLTHVKQNMLHLWLIVLHLNKLCHIVCHIWLCAGTDLQCSGRSAWTAARTWDPSDSKKRSWPLPQLGGRCLQCNISGCVCICLGSFPDFPSAKSYLPLISYICRKGIDTSAAIHGMGHFCTYNKLESWVSITHTVQYAYSVPM
jgi:hypothetical protein